MGIWIELGIFGLVFVFAFWQMHDVRKAQEQMRDQMHNQSAHTHERPRRKEGEVTVEKNRNQPSEEYTDYTEIKD